MGFPATTQSFPDIPFLRATSFEFQHEPSRTPHHEDPLQEDIESSLEVPAPQERLLEIYQQGKYLIFKEAGKSLPINHQGSPLAVISPANKVVEVGAIGGNIDNTDNKSDTGHEADTDGAKPDPDSFWKSGKAPSWASDWGIDQYGHWVTFTVKGNDKTITQRLRWMMPGHFRIGSPVDEPERYDDEGPQHQATLHTGFWLFDTTCTQDLWQTVMGTNPSRFKREDRPVEQVNWNDVQEFLGRIETQVPGIDLVLPSEAEWEYSCRAGTTTPFSFGGNITPEQVNYNGDYPYMDGKPGQYRKCTVPVASLPPNPWGLYEMHGNVWEWTRDYWYENYQEMPAGDPPEARVDIGPDVGRVVRGGSWRNVARVVRSAVRDRNKPGDHSSNLGFRCARIHSGDEPAGMNPVESEETKAHVAEPSPLLTGVAIMDQDRISTEDITLERPYPVPPKTFSIHTGQEHLTFRCETKPTWASAIGRDRFGLWAEISLESDSGNNSTSRIVTQRLRWIPPGRFIMGSPKSEWAAFPKYDQEKWCDQEGPQHPVILTQGYWLFDTPCTQALWETIMGDNPSRFRSSERPVESISWEETNEFMEKINGRIPGLNLALPTEAQWEYACRAGSKTATYAGAMEILGSNNTPILDAIAWYGGNSGVEFELDNGYDSADWREKQYEHERAGTHPVGEKQANPWGLYDMLGNVWEWCRDGQRRYDEKMITDPIGPMETGVGRMVRGGSWYYFARYVRAASRLWYLPGVRLDRLGFRCAGLQP
uniref:Formylglycine-generating enzyme, required for sulfatase activity, contains SUMF1/FGE domain n=1 Tax=Candidatus Kentrum sp. FW TaxID=2126338 RepID=A0A450RU94_9GAMM|nr:MAG: Formylglycine-generating enzyme, required for sulfatase activity, contains SUMF1/FGE domain [Candidatus Kentron sp. FW]